MVRLVLFDIDGTLIRSGGVGERSFAQVCAMEFNIHNGTEAVSFAGRTDPSIVRDIFRRHHVEPSPENFRRFFDCHVFCLDHLLGQTRGRILPGVREMIDGLQAMRTPPRLGLLTGNIRLGAQIKLTHYPLWEHFETGAFGDDHEDRNQIAVIARERGMRLLARDLDGDEILVIGDTPMDIACAKAIGARSLAVASGVYGLDQLREHHPTWAMTDLRHCCLEELCG